MVGWDFNWNFFNFHPKWNLELIGEMSGILVALAAIWFLARASRDKTSRVVSLLVCVLLAGFGVAGSLAEPLDRPQPVQKPEISRQMSGNQAIAEYFVKTAIARVFDRSEPSPIWYRGGRMLLMFVPGVFWVWWTLPHAAQQRAPAKGSQPIPSD
jgi:hypothetical protein